MTNGAVITTTDYAGNYIYQNNALQFISQPEGYLEPNGQGGYDYGYRLKDHLGNIRLTFVDFNHNGSIALSEITEENNYYPFGLKHKGYNDDYSSNRNAIANKFKYNGKELNDELGLNLYDYGARFYDPALGRFHTIDPLAEDYPFQSPFIYGANNPIRFIDFMGMSAADPPSWFGSAIRLLFGTSGDIDAPEEVEIPDQTRQVTKAAAIVDDAADVVNGVGEVLEESIPSALEVSGMTIKVIGYVAAPATDGASLALVPLGQAIESSGTAADVLKDVSAGNFGDAVSKSLVSLGFAKLGKAIDKESIAKSWKWGETAIMKSLNEIATQIGSLTRHATSKTVKEKNKK